MRLLRAAFAVSLGLSACPVRAFGAEPGQETTPRTHYDLQHTSWPWLLGETGGATLIFIGFSAASGDVPKQCRWCEPTAFDRGARNALLAGNPKAVGWASHGVSLGAVPLLAIGGTLMPALQDQQGARGEQDLFILLNTFIFTTGVTDGIKKLAARQRPAFHYGVQDRTEAATLPGEANLSFYSGDTAWAFSLAACGTTLAYLRNYESAPWLLGGGALLATTAGVMRISADMHWATDVMTGALVGTALGVSVPLLLHRRQGSEASGLALQPLVGPGSIGLAGTW